VDDGAFPAIDHQRIAAGIRRRKNLIVTIDNALRAGSGQGTVEDGQPGAHCGSRARHVENSRKSDGNVDWERGRADERVSRNQTGWVVQRRGTAWN
jgi:hypothetical protein